MSYNNPSASASAFIFGQNNVAAVTTDNLNTLVANVSALGGGTIYLGAGTYILTEAITGKSSVSIVGISPSATTIYCAASAYNLSFAGTSVYTTGTITAASGVNITGSGTTWTGNVTAGQYLFLGTRWYKIATVTDNTHIVLSEGYGDNVTLPSTYRIATPIVDVVISNLTITGSSGTGIEFTDALDIQINNVVSVSNNKGFTFTNLSRMTLDKVLAAANTSSGYEMTNIGLCDWSSVNSSNNGANGFLMSNIKTISGLLSGTANTGDGFNITTGVNLDFTLEASGNGGQGVELVSACNSNNISGFVSGNTSDGIKLTGTDDNNLLNDLQVTGNGGWGINIANANCDINVLIGVICAGNSSGSLTGSGTGTLKSTTVNSLP